MSDQAAGSVPASAPQGSPSDMPIPEVTGTVIRKVAVSSFLGNFIEWFDDGS